ncbi:MAG: hypothetical protein WCA06_07750 [Terrimicrobiaceae bacterium]
MPGTLVWKVGKRTGLTVGIVDDPMGPVIDDVSGVTNNVILVRALAGYESNDIPMLADEGDSGSILLDLSNRVLGIVTGNFQDETDDGEEQFFTYACNIDPVLAFLKATINQSPAPAGPTAAIVIPSEEREESSDVDFGEQLHAFQRRVETTASGRVLIALVERHAAETHDLVTKRRAVTVTWHRNQGPAFVARFARALSEPYRALPAEANGARLQSMLSVMAAVLRQHGSPHPPRRPGCHEPWILGLLDDCGSLEELLSRLEASSPALSTHGRAQELSRQPWNRGETRQAGPRQLPLAE